MKKLLLTLMTAVVSTIGMAAGNDVPAIGAQVFIEPGQSAERVEGWFATMEQCGMTVCRIRMFEAYCRGPQGWDFSLFDRAFDCAHKHGVRVFATIFPDMEGNGIGGFKFPVDAAHEKAVNAFTDALVAHFKDHPALMAWVLVNEPGVEGVLPDEPFTNERFAAWKTVHPHEEYTPKGYPALVHFDTERFLLEYNTTYLESIADRIRAIDPSHGIHVNNHQIFKNAAEYDFPSWRRFLTSLGASAHPSWHFGYFGRSRYGIAMAANCDIIRSGAGDIPWWITELQAGNNTYSAFNAFCPSPSELAGWMWTGIGNGAKGVIFWTLNPRSVGGEAGEWALLDMQGGLSDRAIAAKGVACALQENAALFSGAEPLESPVSVLYCRESLWAEKQVQLGDPSDMDYEGRHEGGVMKSAVAMYEALMGMGVKPLLGEMSEYDWNRDSYSGRCIILSGQVCIPSRYYAPLRDFVSKGGKLIVEGLSFYYDEYMHDVFGLGFPLADVFGGTLKEAFCTPGDRTISFGGTKLPVHLWDAVLDNGERFVRNEYGAGSVTWIPSMTSLGAIRSGSLKALSSFLAEELPVMDIPLRFRRFRDGFTLQTMRSGKGFITVVSNNSSKRRRVRFDTTMRMEKNIYEYVPGGQKVRVGRRSLSVPSGATVVTYWE